MTIPQVQEGRLVQLAWAALLLQTIACFVVTAPWAGGDTPVYLALAEAIEMGQYGWFDGGVPQPDPLRPPGYPVFLWAFLHALQLPRAAVVVFQLLAYLLAVLIAQKHLVRRDVSPIPFLALSLAYIFPAIYSAYLLTEALTMLLVTAGAILLDGRQTTFREAAAVGCLFGGAALIRSDMVLLPVVAVAVLVLRAMAVRRFDLSVFRLSSTVMLTAALVLSPYMLWNYQNFGTASPVPVASAVGNSLYHATWQGKLPLADLDALYSGSVTARQKASGLLDEVMKANAEIGAPPLTAPWNPAAYPTTETQIRSTEVFRRLAVDRIRQDPIGYLEHVGGSVWRLWNTAEYPSSTPAIVRRFLAIISAVVTVLGLGGVALSVCRPAGWPLSFGQALIPIYVLGVHVWLHAEARYTASVRVLLVMNASASIWWLWKRLPWRSLLVRNHL